MNNLKHLLLAASMTVFLGCSEKQDKAGRALNEIAETYVRTGLFIGQYDADFVDAYYGPDSLKPQHKPSEFPKDSILRTIDSLQKDLNKIAAGAVDSSSARAKWMSAQLTAFSRRVKIFTGETASFDEESQDLFGVKAPEYPASHYQQLIDSLDRILPGNGTVQDRFQAMANRFLIPKEKLDTVFKATIAEARKRTIAHYKLPAEEKFTLTYVTGKPWNGYNWYKGGYTSEIQINTDIGIFIERAIDVGSHESYPGHHVYNMLLEKNLYRDKGWVEISLYPLFSPQSFIAEGSANYGIDLVFPGDEKIRFSKNLILPLAGLDTAGINLYYKALAIRGKLNYARNEAARGLVNGTMSEKQALDWLIKYCLYNEETALKSIGFVKKYRSYVINYNYGQDAVRRYIGKGNAGQQWDRFSNLLSNPVSTDELMK
jgi:hypothetical protein